MKLAIVHDDFIQHGGAERLVLELLRLYPDAILYTSYISKEWQQVFNTDSIKVKTSFMQYLPAKKKLNKFYACLGFYPLAFESFNFDEFDVVISVSARFAHGVITKPNTYHISYVNSPPRMFWEFHDYFENFAFSSSNLITKVCLGFLKIVSAYHRTWDYAASRRSDKVLANSKTPQSKIQRYYGRGSEIVYPFVDIKLYESVKLTKEDFYLVISRLVSWKKVDQAIEACIQTGDRLKAVGTGEQLTAYKKLAEGHPNIEILGYVDENTKLTLLASCKALINTQCEDFGIVPLEAMACGKPVIAYGKGGVLETVIPGKTGVFYTEQTVKALSEILSSFNADAYLMTDCIHQARKFSLEVFTEKIQKSINSVYLKD